MKKGPLVRGSFCKSASIQLQQIQRESTVGFFTVPNYPCLLFSPPSPFFQKSVFTLLSVLGGLLLPCGSALHYTAGGIKELSLTDPPPSTHGPPSLWNLCRFFVFFGNFYKQSRLTLVVLVCDDKVEVKLSINEGTLCRTEAHVMPFRHRDM